MIGANELADEFNRPPPQISQPLGRSRPTLCCDLVESIQEKMSVARTPCSHQVVGSWKTYTSGVSLKGFGRIGLRLMVSEIDVNGELRRSFGAAFVRELHENGAEGHALPRAVVSEENNQPVHCEPCG